jgi:hypothetical protein
MLDPFEKKRCFFEKKNQKTFIDFRPMPLATPGSKGAKVLARFF